MAINNRNLPAGTVLLATYKKEQHRVLVLEAEDGTKGYQLLDEHGGGTEIFKSLSSAGSAVMNGVACNGWRFWSVEGEEPAADPDAPKPEKAKRSKASTEKNAPVFRNIKRTPNQRGVEEGKVRWYCSSCQKGFTLSESETPEACPEGHPAEVEDELAPAS